MCPNTECDYLYGGIISGNTCKIHTSSVAMFLLGKKKKKKPLLQVETPLCREKTGNCRTSVKVKVGTGR